MELILVEDNITHAAKDMAGTVSWVTMAIPEQASDGVGDHFQAVPWHEKQDKASIELSWCHEESQLWSHTWVPPDQVHQHFTVSDFQTFRD